MHSSNNDFGRMNYERTDEAESMIEMKPGATTRYLIGLTKVAQATTGIIIFRQDISYQPVCDSFYGKRLTVTQNLDSQRNPCVFATRVQLVIPV
jgi:hypothetical protein